MTFNDGAPDRPVFDQPSTPEEVFALFESRTNLERTTAHLRLYRLERMAALMERLGSPETTRPVVHLAGSKGKGSTAAYLTSLLAAGGATVGLYTSPHVRSYRERFVIVPPEQTVGSVDPEHPGTEADTVLVEQGRRVWAVVQRMMESGAEEDDLPTTFELLTALAFCYFPAAGCDWIVLETGLGGRLDATNVCRPALTLITRIELEHTDYLGDTLTLIAGEKAGIIKDGTPLLLAPQSKEPDAVFRRTARERNAPLEDVTALPAAALPAAALPAADGEEGAPRGLSGDRVVLPRWAGGGSVRLAMLGEVHRTNAAMALAAMHRLVQDGQVPAPAPAAVEHAVAHTRLPGRGEVVDDVVFDGAHTVESATNIAATLRRLLPVGSRIPVVLGVVAGKNVEGITDALKPIASRFIISRPGRFKPGDPLEVHRRVASRGCSPILEPNPAEALRRARALRDAAEEIDDTPTEAATRSRDDPNQFRLPILVSGSFYMVAEIRRIVIR